MAWSSIFPAVTGLLLMVVLLAHSDQAQARRRVFDIKACGAPEDGRTDISEALIAAWNGACNSTGATNAVLIPCGYVDQSKVTARGVLLDGQEASAWLHSDCRSNPPCHQLPIVCSDNENIDSEAKVESNLKLAYISRNLFCDNQSMRFEINACIHHMASLNSENCHLSLFACSGLTVEPINTTDPRNSPNTDGINISRCSNVLISSSSIGTGNNCIPLGLGSKFTNITGVSCLPGHGMSIRSLRGAANEPVETLIYILDCIFESSTNGIRTKTQVPPYESTLSKLAIIDNVVRHSSEPVIIDQQYCPSKNCSHKASLVIVFFASWWLLSAHL